MFTSAATRQVLSDLAQAIPTGTRSAQTTELCHFLVGFDRRYAGITPELLNKVLIKERVALSPIPSYDGPAVEATVREGIHVTALLKAVLR